MKMEKKKWGKKRCWIIISALRKLSLTPKNACVLFDHKRRGKSIGHTHYEKILYAFKVGIYLPKKRHSDVHFVITIRYSSSFRTEQSTSTSANMSLCYCCLILVRLSIRYAMSIYLKN